EKVYEMDDEQSRFSHRFPVEISVPPNLVDNLEDITVSVDAFDYELPSQNKLNIKASIHIHGINQTIEDKEPTEKNMNENDTVESTSLSQTKEEGTSDSMVNDEKDRQEVRSEENEMIDQVTEKEETVLSNEQTESLLDVEEEEQVDRLEEVMEAEETSASQMEVVEETEDLTAANE